MDSQDGTEDFLVEELVVGVINLVDGGLDEETDRAVVLATSDHLDGRILVALINDGLDLVERSAVDNRAHESLKVLVRVANGDLLDTSLESLDELLGPGLGDISSGGSRALLALVLESTSDGVVDSVGDIGGRMDKVEVLAGGLADNSGEVTVALLSNTLADLAIDGSEHVRGADKVETGELAVLEDDVGDLGGITGHELDDIRGKTGLDEDVVDDSAGVDVVLRRLPEDDVAEKSRSRDQATTQGSEVERRHGVDETLERTVVNSAPHAVATAVRLLLKNLSGVVAVQTEEVSQLSGGINLALPDVLALAEHSSGNKIISVLGGNELSSTLEDGDTVHEGSVLP